MEVDRKIQDLSTWQIWEMPPEGKWNLRLMYGFAVSLRVPMKIDFTDLSVKMPAGVVLCSTKCLAGYDHLRRILYQTAAYWQRGKYLARNKSLDLLMRVTCQSQIERAIEFAAISSTNKIAIFGLSENKQVFQDAISLLKKEVDQPVRDDTLIELGPAKKKYLSKVHRLPGNCSDEQLVSYLQEKSVILVFSK